MYSAGVFSCGFMRLVTAESRDCSASKDGGTIVHSLDTVLRFRLVQLKYLKHFTRWIFSTGDVKSWKYIKLWAGTFPVYTSGRSPKLCEFCWKRQLKVCDQLFIIGRHKNGRCKVHIKDGWWRTKPHGKCVISRKLSSRYQMNLTDMTWILVKFMLHL